MNVVEIARTWLGTPYHHAACVKGAGVDCLMLVCTVYEEAGLIPHIVPGYYPMDWHLHRSEELYLAGIEQYCDRVEGDILPGDIALYRFARCASHAAIVTAWPEIIHAHRGEGVVLAHGLMGVLAERLDSVWRVRDRECA